MNPWVAVVMITTGTMKFVVAWFIRAHTVVMNRSGVVEMVGIGIHTVVPVSLTPITMKIIILLPRHIIPAPLLIDLPTKVRK